MIIDYSDLNWNSTEQWAIAKLIVEAYAEEQIPDSHIFDVALTINGREIDFFRFVHLCRAVRSEDMQRRAASLLQDKFADMMDRLDGLNESIDLLIADACAKEMDGYSKGE